MLKVDDPYTGGVAYEAPLSSVKQVMAIAEKNRAAQKQYWASTSLKDRKKLLTEAVNELTRGQNSEKLAKSITQQMGKPLAQAKGELNGTRARADAMVALAEKALQDIVPDQPQQGRRRVVLEPIGQVLTLSPWNYPLLTAINSIAPAILAGCSVVVSHGPRAPEVSFFIEKAFKAAGAPDHLVSAVSCTHETTHEAIQCGLGDHVVFTGSVQGGHAVAKTLGSLSNRFVRGTFELGGKDPIYVAADVKNVKDAAASIVDGAFYNAGQSCCAVERVYVHESVHDEFVTACQKVVETDYHLGDPLNDAKASMGPMAQLSAIAFLEGQVKDAVSKGAKIVVGTGKGCKDAAGKGRFFSPTLLSNCNNSMEIVREESFGPVLPIIKVKNDEEAVRLMNDSRYGLTAGVYTADVDRAERLAKQVNTGTFFMNRCDALDPNLAFSGRKDSGNGVALSMLGFSQFVIPKSLNFRM